MPSLLPAARSSLTRLVRRRRRPLAALLAAAAVLVGLSTLRSEPAPVIAGAPGPTALLRPGEVAIPVALPSAALARTLAVGDVIDVLGVVESDTGQRHATVAASSARVMEIPEAGSGFGATATAVVLLAVRGPDALTLTSAAASGALGVVIRRR